MDIEEYQSKDIAGKILYLASLFKGIKDHLDVLNEREEFNQVESQIFTILNDLELVDGEEIAVIVSGLGGTPLMELYVLYDAIEDYFASRNIKVYKSYVGDYVTSLEMRGAALTVLRLNDEFKQLLEVPVDCVGVKQK